MLIKKIVQSVAKSKFRTALKPLRKLFPTSLRMWAKEDRVNLLISVDELKPQYEKACNYLSETLGESNLGDYLEFGVCHGTSMSCMNQVLNRKSLDKVRLFGFDSFEGMPASAKNEAGGWYPGQFRSELDETRYFLTRNGIDWKRTWLTKGWFADTLKEEFKSKHYIKKASLIMIDCDIYSAAKESLNFCASLIVDKAVIIFDDWNSDNLADQNQGEKQAFTEFLEENPQFMAEEFGEYRYKGALNGKLFLVTNVSNAMKVAI
jgi:O-methyltransferase